MNNEMGGACGTYETAETYRDLVGKSEGKQLVSKGVDGRIILK